MPNLDYSDFAIQLHAAKGLLGIEKPVKVVIRDKHQKKQKDLAAYCEPSFRKGKIIGFRIYVNLDILLNSGYTLRDTVLHEMVHVAQFQHKVFDDENHHDARFVKLTKYLKKELKKLGVSVGKLYSPDVDTD